MNDVARFMDKAEPEPNSGCWLWRGSGTSNGYGSFRCGSKRDGTRRVSLAHRRSYELFNGPIPHGIHVLHRCDVRCCVNPGHLFLGTPGDNIRDAQKKGRSRYARGESSGNVKLNPSAVHAARWAYRVKGVQMKVLAGLYGVSATAIQNIMSGRTWGHLGRIF